MWLRQLEAKILSELLTVVDDRKIRQKDIMEWSSGVHIEAEEGEVKVYLPSLKVYVCYRERS